MSRRSGRCSWTIEMRKRAFRSLGLSERAAEVRLSPLQIDHLEPTGSASCSWTMKCGKARLDPTSIRQAAERGALSSRRRLTYDSRVWALQLDIRNAESALGRPDKHKQNQPTRLPVTRQYSSIALPAYPENATLGVPGNIS